jgi:hypothetical protein
MVKDSRHAYPAWRIGCLLPPDPVLRGYGWLLKVSTDGPFGRLAGYLNWDGLEQG